MERLRFEGRAQQHPQAQAEAHQAHGLTVGVQDTKHIFELIFNIRPYLFV